MSNCVEPNQTNATNPPELPKRSWGAFLLGLVLRVGFVGLVIAGYYLVKTLQIILDLPAHFRDAKVESWTTAASQLTAFLCEVHAIIWHILVGFVFFPGIAVLFAYFLWRALTRNPNDPYTAAEKAFISAIYFLLAILVVVAIAKLIAQLGWHECVALLANVCLLVVVIPLLLRK